MKRIEFVKDRPIVVTFLSEAKEVQEYLDGKAKVYYNYTVMLNKVNGTEVNEKRLLQATPYLYREFVGRNVEPGCYVKITMKPKDENKPDGAIWYDVQVGGKKEIEKEEPGDIDKLKGRDVAEIMKQVSGDLVPYFAEMASNYGCSIEVFIPCVTSVFIAVKDLEY